MQRIDRLRTLTKQEIQKVRFVFAPTHPVLAALDYRSNDLFRYTFGSEDQLSNKILIAFLSDLLGIRIVRLQIRESEPVKTNEDEKGIRFDLLVEIFDDQGREMVVNLEMQNYRMKGSLSLRSQAYLSRMVSSQIVAGENYEFCPVIQIMIVNRLPNMKKHSHFTHQSRYCVMEDHILMPDERCRILWVEMDYLNEMDKKSIEEWRMAEKILYMTRYSLDPEKQEVIQELKEKEEVIQMMEEKRMEFLRSTSMDIALMRTRFDEIDEQKIYEKGQRLGKKIGECIGERIGRQQGELIGERRGELIGRQQGEEKQRRMLQQMLSIRIPMGEEEAELLQQLNGDELLLLSERHERIKTSEDLAEQVHEIVNQRTNSTPQPKLAVTV